MHSRVVLFAVLFSWAGGGRAPAATEGQTEKSCLACHDANHLAELKKQQGPEIIPEDPREREAFAAVIGENDPRRRRESAERFISTYPQSWMLEPAYEIASKASIALGDLSAALDFGARSLRLLPENPFLLAPLASVEARVGNFEAAARDAEDALWYLERFDRPTSMEERTWPQVRNRLEAQCLFESGRAAVSTGRAAQAEVSLQKAVALDRAAPGPALLLGMIYMNENRPADAAGFLALAAAPDTSLRSQALDRLHIIYSGLPAPGGSFDEWRASLKPALPESHAAPRSAVNLPAYAGSESCRACHSAQHANWQQTGMGRMFRPYDPRNVIGDFTSGQTIPDDAGKPVARAVVRSGRHYLEIREGKRWNSYPVDYLIGSKWQQGYATKLPGGEIQVFPLQYNRLERRWVNYWKIIDAPDSIRTDIQRFHEVVPGATYQLECAPCHTSQERFAGHTYQARTASFREGGINCEMCHGPSAAHVAAMRSGRAYKKEPAEPPVDFKQISATEYVAICAQCHMQSGERNPEPGGAMNYSESGPKFYRVLSSRPYVDYSRKAFYKDGRFRETVFIVESFVRSACFRKGGATCRACHDPHPSDAASNPVSLKFRADPDRMCIDCHTQFRDHPEAHTHHSASSEGSRCVSCHMPRIMKSLLFTARSHQIDDIPDAALTARFGSSDSPNACLLCHKDKDSAWLIAKLGAWKK